MNVSWKLFGFQETWTKIPGFWTKYCVPAGLLVLLEIFWWSDILAPRCLTNRDHDLVFVLNTLRASAQ